MIQGRIGLELFAESEAVHLRHDNIGNNEIGFLDANAVQYFETVGCGIYGIPVFFKNQAKKFCCVGLSSRIRIFPCIAIAVQFCDACVRCSTGNFYGYTLLSVNA